MDARNLKFILIIFAFILAFTSFTFALGVSSPYWKSNPLEMQPGEFKEISFTLVNKINEPNAKAFVSMIEDAGIAAITSGSEYIVQPGTSNTKVNLKISIPKNAAIGTAYNVEFSVKSTPEAEGGNVQLGVGYNIDFPVIVVAESKQPSAIKDTFIETPQESGKISSFILGVVLFILVFLILWWIFKKKRHV